jgi:hypothetical protein
MRRAGVLFIATLAFAVGAGAEPVELEADVVDNLLEIRERNPELREDAFSKMGGSSVASKAFLHCFATDFVDLGNHSELADTIAYFNTGQRNSFNRQSEAAGVSWNLRYVLGGRPANFRQELADTNARWALVLFGSNDAQNENERVYLKRLVYLIEQMEELGVVPILGAALPRRNNSKNRWIVRFNLITEAVAKHWSLPYIDYHAALSALPRKGLARDGVHPNVLPPGGLKNTCRLTEKGLRYGNNVRNLLTLEMLDALRRLTDTDTGTDTDADAGTDTDPRTDTDAGTATAPGTDNAPGTDMATAPRPRPSAPGLPPSKPDPDPVSGPPPPPDPLPLTALIDKPSLPSLASFPKACGKPRPGARHYTTSLTLHERTPLRASALDFDGERPRVLLVRHDEETGASRCVRRRMQTAEVDARPGMWDLIVEVSARGAEEGEMLILLARDPR